MEEIIAKLIAGIIIGLIAAGIFAYACTEKPSNSIASSCRTQGGTPFTSSEGVACMKGDTILWLHCYNNADSSTNDFDACYDILFR